MITRKEIVSQYSYWEEAAELWLKEGFTKEQIAKQISNTINQIL